VAPRRILIIILSIALSGCSGLLRAKMALFGPHHHDSVATLEAPPPPPQVADGLWAILDPGCPKPTAPNFHAWPKCAQPFWINGAKAVVVRSGVRRNRQTTDSSYAADYNLAGGDPVIAQVGTEKDGYMFLALTRLSTDGQGRLIDAIGAAVACPKQAMGGPISIRPNLNGCDTESLNAVRQAAAETLRDRSALTEVAWIAPGAPGPQ
jgi:hypothetical protein